MNLYLISEDGEKLLIIDKWEEKVKRFIELSKLINKVALDLEQSHLIGKFGKRVNEKVHEISFSEK